MKRETRRRRLHMGCGEVLTARMPHVLQRRLPMTGGHAARAVNPKTGKDGR
jgi:hypothetical protein